MHLRPADFFTSNPALDVPSKRNNASVLVPCCGGSGGEKPAGDGGEASVQNDPVSHLQGAKDVDAEDLGTETRGKQEEAKLGRRLSKAFSGLMRSKGKE